MSTEDLRAVRIEARPRRGLRLDDAAAYVGLGRAKFAMLVHDGRMPPPKRIDRVQVWDIRRLDEAFDAFESEVDDNVSNPWDD